MAVSFHVVIVNGAWAAFAVFNPPLHLPFLFELLIDIWKITIFYLKE